jgi:hypothetical protein
LHIGQSLDESTGISPFSLDQERLPKKVSTQSLLFGWKIMNKLPLSLREGLSMAIWRKPFYPTETDYVFAAEAIDTAPVQVAVCRRK